MLAAILLNQTYLVQINFKEVWTSVTLSQCLQDLNNGNSKLQPLYKVLFGEIVSGIKVFSFPYFLKTEK